jgi:hypothetical protein
VELAHGQIVLDTFSVNLVPAPLVRARTHYGRGFLMFGDRRVPWPDLPVSGIRKRPLEDQYRVHGPVVQPEWEDPLRGIHAAGLVRSMD